MFFGLKNKMKKILTLCLIREGENILLGMKKRGFGEGRWNGFGGKLNEDEEIEEAAKREVMEEVNIEVNKLEKRGIIEFEFKGGSDIFEVHVFHTNEFNGNPVETEEMKPEWFNVNNIPFEEMWSGDRNWFPLFLAEKKFKGKFLFDEHDQVIDSNLCVVGEI